MIQGGRSKIKFLKATSFDEFLKISLCIESLFIKPTYYASMSQGLLAQLLERLTSMSIKLGSNPF